MGWQGTYKWWTYTNIKVKVITNGEYTNIGDIERVALNDKYKRCATYERKVLEQALEWNEGAWQKEWGHAHKEWEKWHKKHIIGVFFMFLSKVFFIRGNLFMFLGKGFLAKGRKEVSRYCFDYFPLQLRMPSTSPNGFQIKFVKRGRWNRLD